MSTTTATVCGHDWQSTEVYYNRVARDWAQTHLVLYCPACHKWDSRPVAFFDAKGIYTKLSSAAVNTEEYERMMSERQSWLAAHYPEHVEEADA